MACCKPRNGTPVNTGRNWSGGGLTGWLPYRFVSVKTGEIFPPAAWSQHVKVAKLAPPRADESWPIGIVP
jgi:hypothetical protein